MSNQVLDLSRDERSDNKEVEESKEANIFFTPPLYIQRYIFAYDFLFKANPRVERMADFGCAEGGFVTRLKKLPYLTTLYAVDISDSSLDECQERAAPIPWDIIFGRFVSLELSVVKADITKNDPLFQNLDAITCIELIEHLPAEQLKCFPATVFGFFKPRIVIISTPNREFNVLFPTLKDGRFRHWDHKFEWTRDQFQPWCHDICKSYGYTVEFSGVGQTSDQTTHHVGFCTQIAIFTQQDFIESHSCSSLESTAEVLKTFLYPKRESSPPKVEPIDWSYDPQEDEHSLSED